MGISAGFMVPHPPLIIPDVGRGEEKKIQKTIDAYKKAAEAVGRLQPETIVLLSPHQTMYADYFHISPGKGARGDFGQFRAGQVPWKYPMTRSLSVRCVRLRLIRIYRRERWENGRRNWIMAPWCPYIL